MQKFIRHFARQGDGAWICARSCELQSPVGRIQVTEGTYVMRGVRFMNFDLAAALDEEYARQQQSAGGR